ncbi:MAG: hypothetical protein Tsb0020_47300 [Haliangiales bacterium]
MSKLRAQASRKQRASAAMQAPHYKILGRIASGGMGAVYLGAHADDVALSRLVAVKIIHEHLAENRVFTDMLLDEAQVAQRIDHPNVVGIIDVGEFLGRHFVVMPYIEGGTLSEMVRRHRHHLPTGLLMKVLIDALNGLHTAHSLVGDDGQPLGLVHRDISPGNILIGTDGVARVIDFGVAKAASRITHTAPGTVKGKFSYMAPEQAMGDSIDLRADVFSAGVVMWTVLTGKRLFTGKNSAHTIRNLMTAEVLPPSRIRPKVPQCYDEVCLKALQRNPDRRFQSAAEMAEALYTASLIAEKQISRDEIASWVSSTFEERINHRREIIERLRADPEEMTKEEHTFELDVDDLDLNAPLDGITPATPSARIHNHPPAGILEQFGPDAPDLSVGRHESASAPGHSGSMSSGLQGLRGSVTPGSQPSSLAPARISEPSSALSSPSARSRESRPDLSDSRPNISESRSSISVVRRPSSSNLGQPGASGTRRAPLVVAALLLIAGLALAFTFRDRLLALVSPPETADPASVGPEQTDPPKPVLEPVVIQVDSDDRDDSDASDAAAAVVAAPADAGVSGAAADTADPLADDQARAAAAGGDGGVSSERDETASDAERAERADSQRESRRRRTDRRNRNRNRNPDRRTNPSNDDKGKRDKPPLEIPENPYLDE